MGGKSHSSSKRNKGMCVPYGSPRNANTGLHVYSPRLNGSPRCGSPSNACGSPTVTFPSSTMCAANMMGHCSPRSASPISFNCFSAPGNSNIVVCVPVVKPKSRAFGCVEAQCEKSQKVVDPVTGQEYDAPPTGWVRLSNGTFIPDHDGSFLRAAIMQQNCSNAGANTDPLCKITPHAERKLLETVCEKEYGLSPAVVDEYIEKCSEYCVDARDSKDPFKQLINLFIEPEEDAKKL